MNKGTIAVVSSAMLAVVAWITASAEEKNIEHKTKLSPKESDYNDYYDPDYDCDGFGYEDEGGLK